MAAKTMVLIVKVTNVSHTNPSLRAMEAMVVATEMGMMETYPRMIASQMM
jgi:hypothetical protein